jgi:hypothetical protein
MRSFVFLRSACFTPLVDCSDYRIDYIVRQHRKQLKNQDVSLDRHIFNNKTASLGLNNIWKTIAEKTDDTSFTCREYFADVPKNHRCELLIVI